MGDFFILGGQLVYVADVGDTIKVPNGATDARLRVIYLNGTESNLLLESLQRALYKDEAGRRLTNPNPGPLFSQNWNADDTESGTIYVLRSLSNHPFVAEHRELIHKIGVSILLLPPRRPVTPPRISTTRPEPYAYAKTSPVPPSPSRHARSMDDQSPTNPDRRAQRRSAERQAAAQRTAVNRQNAQRSTGPRTAHGKAASSRNSFRHGHYSAQTVLEGEPMADFQDLREDLLSQYEPKSHIENALVEEIAQSRWRILRFRRHEARIMDDSEKVYQQPELLFTIHRLMAGAERAFYRALKELKQLQNARQTTEEESGYAETGFVPPNLLSPPGTAAIESGHLPATESEDEFVQPPALRSILIDDDLSRHLP